MAITAAHEGVFKHPTYPGLYVVDPAKGRSPSYPEFDIDVLRAAAGERKRSRTVRTIVIFVVAVVVVFAVLTAIGYNAFSSAFIAIGAGIVADAILLPLLYRPGQPVAADKAIESNAALGIASLELYKVPVDDSTPWSTVWEIASAYSEVDEEESTLDQLEYLFDEENAGNADAKLEREQTGRREPVTEFDVERQRARMELALAEADAVATRLGYPPASRPLAENQPLREVRPGDDLI